MLQMNPPLDYEDIKVPNSSFWGDVRKQRRNCLVSLSLNVYMVLRNLTPGDFAYT